MSIASLILALLPAMAAKASPKKTKRERELERQVETLTFALDYQREAATAIQAANERLIEERDALRRERAQPLAEASQMQLQLAQNALLAQQHQAMAVQNCFQQSALGTHQQQGVLGMQQSNWAFDCNCVPDRVQLLYP